MPKVIILDYGLGNLFSVQRALEYIGVKPIITDDKKEIKRAEKIIIPGVGAFKEGMVQLERRGLISLIKEAADSGKSILGICLGMQLLMSKSEEHGEQEGLNLIGGRVSQLFSGKDDDKVKVPHIGWNCLIPSQCQLARNRDCWKGTILEGVEKESFMYFVHSFGVYTDKPEYTIAETHYGENRFCSVVQKDNIMGCQFHPERSGNKGIEILKKFVSYSFDKVRV